MSANPLQKAMHLHQSGKYDKAKKLYQRLLRKKPDDVDALHFYGLLQFHQGNAKKGIELVTRATELNPDYPDAQNNLGNMLLNQGQLELAKAHYLAALKSNPDKIEAHNNLGILLRHQGDFEGSKYHLQRALELAPDWNDARYNLGNTHAEAGDHEQAMDCYRKALSGSDRYADVLKRMGQVFYAKGKIEEAEQLYREWIELEPDNPELRHMLAAVSGDRSMARASEDYVRQHFDRFAQSFDAQLERLEYKGPGLVAEQFDKHRQGRENLRVLDIGCGTGLCGPRIQGSCRSLIGVDLSKRMLEQARARESYNRFELSDMVRFLQATDESFDVVISADALIYFGDLADVMRGVYKVLEPGGLFCFTLEKASDDESVDPEFHLDPHGRYSHHPDYITRLAEAYQFDICDLFESEVRKELKKPVNGLVVTLRK